MILGALLAVRLVRMEYVLTVKRNGPSLNQEVVFQMGMTNVILVSSHKHLSDMYIFC